MTKTVAPKPWWVRAEDAVTGAVSNTTRTVQGWFSPEEKLIIEFFTPLMQQVEQSAISLGKGELQVGLQILKDCAIAAVAAAATSPNPVVAAETAFLATGAIEGVTAIHNAEAGAIKAAVAIVQTQTGSAALAAVANSALTKVADAAVQKLGVKK